MPVDHNERRRLIAETTAAVIAREGLDAATIRRIAAELGGPTKIITYYFPEKQELLHFTWEHLAQKYSDLLSARDPADAVGRLLVMAASDDYGVTRWRVYAAFLDRAARDPVFAELQRKHTDAALAFIGDTLRAMGVGDDEIPRISLHLNAVVQGISVQAIADQERWSGQRIRNALAEQLEMLLARRSPPA
jgi:AcrR family transcriptional regulator